LLAELHATEPELLHRSLVIDFNVAIHEQIAALGPHVVYGDFTIPETLQHAGVDRARVVLCTIPGDILVSTSPQRLVTTIHELCPDSTLIFTATTFPEARSLYAAGADFVLIPRVDAAQSALNAVRAALNGQIGDLRAASDARFEGSDRREALD
jgi:Trk K+ transport system NAD-binding subunit